MWKHLRLTLNLSVITKESTGTRSVYCFFCSHKLKWHNHKRQQLVLGKASVWLIQLWTEEKRKREIKIQWRTPKWAGWGGDTEHSSFNSTERSYTHTHIDRNVQSTDNNRLVYIVSFTAAHLLCGEKYQLCLIYNKTSFHCILHILPVFDFFAEGLISLHFSFWPFCPFTFYWGCNLQWLYCVHRNFNENFHILIMHASC